MLDPWCRRIAVKTCSVAAEAACQSTFVPAYNGTAPVAFTVATFAPRKPLSAAYLLHRVATPNCNTAIAERFVVYRHAERSADLVLPAVPLACTHGTAGSYKSRREIAADIRCVVVSAPNGITKHTFRPMMLAEIHPSTHRSSQSRPCPPCSVEAACRKHQRQRTRTRPCSEEAGPAITARDTDIATRGHITASACDTPGGTYSGAKGSHVLM
jgi:hypothetical protein